MKKKQIFASVGEKEVTSLRGEDELSKELGAGITAGYSDAQEEKIIVLFWKPDGNEVKFLTASPIKEEEIARYRI